MTGMETDFKTDFESLEPSDLRFGDAESPEPAGLPPAAADFPEPAGKTPAKRRLFRPALAMLALVGAISAGVWLYARPPGLAATRVASTSPSESAIDAASASAPAAVAPSSETTEDSSGWAIKLREVDEVRRLLHVKKDAILRVQQDYRYGILELEEETKHLLKQARIDSLVLARKNSEVDLLLQNIQRRQMYSEALAQPLQWIDAASEELLYLKRRASIDLLVAAVAEGIDMQRHLYDMDLALQKFQPTASRLAIHPGPMTAASLDVIAKRLIEQSKLMQVVPGDDRNREIVAEVCSGNLTAAGELSRLSLKGARCLAESDAKQLFLNRVTELTPLAAQKLSEWPGEWLCLNGLAKLQADVAAHLFAWQGAWISLNGLGELSVEAGQHVAGWNGRQLELMGLHSPFSAEHLMRWEAAGGRLFVPDTLRRAIDLAVGKAPGNSDS